MVNVRPVLEWSRTAEKSCGDIFAVLCYVMLCFVMPLYAMLCYVMLLLSYNVK